MVKRLAEKYDGIACEGNHLKNNYSEEELSEKATTEIFSVVQKKVVDRLKEILLDKYLKGE